MAIVDCNLNHFNAQRKPMNLRYKSVIEQVQALDLSTELNQEIKKLSENLISPYSVYIPQHAFRDIQDFIRITYKLTHSEKYIRFLSSKTPEPLPMATDNGAICTSFDFHLDSELKPRLIEINTNAAFLTLGTFLTLPNEQAALSFDLKGFVQMVQSDYALFSKNSPLKKMAIIDENPESQRLYAEFLLVRDIMRNSGIECDILDYRADLSGYQYIYNRWTDFYLSDPSSESIKTLYTDQKVAFSPSPWEYFLMADKERLIDWQDERFIETILSSELNSEERELFDKIIPKTIALNQDSSEKIWSDRKQLFLKPMRSFGSKQTYRGGTISRKLFESLTQEGFIAQEFIPAPESEFGNDNPKDRMKYDLRAYCYGANTQYLLARLYQGQVTNARTERGGFAPVLIESSDHTES